MKEEGGGPFCVVLWVCLLARGLGLPFFLSFGLFWLPGASLPDAVFVVITLVSTPPFTTAGDSTISSVWCCLCGTKAKTKSYLSSTSSSSLSLSLSLSLSCSAALSLSVILSQLSLLYCFCLGLVHINRELTTSHLRFKTKRVSLSSSLSEESWKEFIQLRNGVPSSDCWSLPESYFLNNNRSLFRLQRRLVCVIEGTKQPLSLLLRPCPTRIYSGVVTLSLLLSLSLLLLSLSRRAACQKRR